MHDDSQVADRVSLNSEPLTKPLLQLPVSLVVTRDWPTLCAPERTTSAVVGFVKPMVANLRMRPGLGFVNGQNMLHAMCGTGVANLWSARTTIWSGMMA